jgi:hypothetical protein
MIANLSLPIVKSEYNIYRQDTDIDLDIMTILPSTVFEKCIEHIGNNDKTALLKDMDMFMEKLPIYNNPNETREYFIKWLLAYYCQSEYYMKSGTIELHHVFPNLDQMIHDIIAGCGRIKIPGNAYKWRLIALLRKPKFTEGEFRSIFIHFLCRSGKDAITLFSNTTFCKYRDIMAGFGDLSAPILAAMDERARKKAQMFYIFHKATRDHALIADANVMSVVMDYLPAFESE